MLASSLATALGQFKFRLPEPQDKFLHLTARVLILRFKLFLRLGLSCYFIKLPPLLVGHLLH
jgi:hypothetical protein